MTRREFEQSVARLLNGEAMSSENDGRVFAASCAIIRHRRGLPDDAMLEISPDEIAAFLAGESRQKLLRGLKPIADDLVLDGVETFH